MKKIIIFFLILILSIFVSKNHINLLYFGGFVKPVVLNIETKENIGDIYFCFNQAESNFKDSKNCRLLDYKNNIYSIKLEQNAINSALFALNDEKKLKNINAISIFNGYKTDYYDKEILNFDKTNIKIKNDNYSAFVIPSLNNNKTFLQKFSVIFESIFYNWYFYIFCYILALFYFYKKKKALNLNFKLLAVLFFLLGFILRISHIDYYPLWVDEIYVYSAIFKPFIKNPSIQASFLDPGNPPLFFIMSNIWLYFFKNSIGLMRLLPVLISMVQMASVYFFAKKILNEKTALTALFLCSINLFIIAQSNELRSYILSMALILFQAWCFFELYKNFNNKKLIIYFLITSLLINTHYYDILFAAYNLVLGLIFFKNNKIKFLITNTASFLTFVPYFLNTYKISLTTYNNWIAPVSAQNIARCISYYFGNLAVFAIILFLIYIYIYILSYREKDNLLEQKSKTVFIYNIFAVIFVFLTSIFISFFKPIFMQRYFCILLPLLIVNCAIILNTDFKTKFQPLIILFIFLFSLNIAKYRNYYILWNISEMIEYSTNNYNNNSSYNRYFLIPATYKNINFYKENFQSHNIKRQAIVMACDEFFKDSASILKYTKGNEKTLLYLHGISYDRMKDKLKNHNVQKINTTTLPIYKIFIN